MWRNVCFALNISQDWGIANFDICTLNWYRDCRIHSLLPMVISRFIWCTRNKVVFEDQKPCIHKTSCQILSVYESIFRGQESLNIKSIGSFEPQFNCPTLFFDGAAQDGPCAADGAIYLNEFHYFTLRLNCGVGTNMKA